MKKFAIIVVSFCFASVFVASAQMSDEAIVEYLTENIAMGKSQSQMASELASKGVSVTQMKRVMASYKRMENLATSTGQGKQSNKIDENRKERAEATEDKAQKKKKNDDNKKTAVDQLREGSQKDIEEDSTASAGVKRQIYGHDIFASENLTFEPNNNAATPESYVLGPGDEVIIDIWGENEATIRQTISPEGLIMVSQIGPVQLAGLTIDAARARIRKSFASKYSALNGSASKVSVTLGKTRTIMVNVMGEVKVPGTYRLSSFSTVFNALYNAGGVTEIGSVRAVKVSRGDKTVASVDIYQYLFNGYASTDIPLKDGDVIVVPAASLLVNIQGKVKRPMFYELIEGETIAKAIEYAGGFEADAYKGNISIVRQTGGEQIVRNVSEDRYASFPLADGDLFEVQPALSRFTDRLEIKGAVKHPGMYQFGDSVQTLSKLVERAGGLSEDAFTGRAQIVREKADLSLEVIAVPLGSVLSGIVADIPLKSNDVLYVSRIHDIDQKGDLRINGYVNFPGNYPYADNTSIEDLILLAGGLADGASTVKVDVSRRIIDPESTSDTGKYAELFSFEIKDGLLADGKPDFLLEPYDIVSVRKSPSFFEQKTVTLIGEFVFPGQYTLQESGERLSEVVARAGGITKYANPRGVLIKRQISDEEREIRNTIASVYTKSVEEAKDSTVRDLVADIYNVGVQFDKALASSGSEYDLILRDGDEIIIPEINMTVTIQGEVLYPNTVPYRKGRMSRYYIDHAGGFSERAKRSDTYVVYANGSVSSGLDATIEPGCAIVVPKKAERKAISVSEAVGIGSSTASLAAVVLSIINMMTPAK